MANLSQVMVNLLRIVFIDVLVSFYIVVMFSAVELMERFCFMFDS